MENNEVLDHLLKIEAKAAALVNDAQIEAKKKIIEAEKKNQIKFEEVYQEEVKKLDRNFIEFKNNTKMEYQEELKAFSEKISSFWVDTEKFFAMLDEFIAGNV
ncbi:MAG: hypothetical protein FWH41_01515 [Treponema sp.]|nr:hypothetical protein [Treponema sp.]